MVTAPDATQSSRRDRLIELLQDSPIVPVITIERLEHAVPLAEALVAGGLRLLEITLRTPVALKAAEAIINDVPEAIVGIGTVLSEEDLVLAAGIGAQFALSPGATANLLEAARGHDLPFIPGIATASELMAALGHGFDLVKFFPAAPAGGIAMLKAMAGPFPQARFCPTGGIDGANAREWLTQPNVLAVGGSWLAPAEDMRQGAWGAITERVRQTLSQLST
jgi:2-dehydro-3-deoxyphosphogluconate aldolase/(4S)-4-hydroxy-2-oxoglutarate aldolase